MGEFYNMDLSIVVVTYNHEKYIKMAMESILKQQLDYSFEVWIGDDCSSDKTKIILKQYMNKTPQNFHYIFREKNIGPDANFLDLYNRTTGEYLIVLEGDDYWIEPLKLQKQLDFLKNNPSYIAVAHNTVVVDREGNVSKDYSYPECKNKEYTLYDFRTNIFAGQTTTIMSKNYYRNNLFNLFKPTVPWAGDKTRNFMFAAHGQVHCFQNSWSAYRYVIETGDSYTANFKKSAETEKNLLQYHKELYEYAKKEVLTKDSVVVAESMYFHLYLSAILKKKVKGVSLLEWTKEFFKAQYKIYSLSYILKKIL